MSDTPWNNVLGRLKAKRLREDEAIATCPAHEDRTPSLRLKRRKDGAVLLHCFAGCTAERIVQAIGLAMRDLFPPRPDAGSGRNHRPLATPFDYVDGYGVLRFRILRLDYGGANPRKRFVVERPDGNGRWVDGLGGETPILFRLPELLAAPPDAPVFVVEGERKADRLAALGFVATTNPFGAGRWSDDFADVLRGRHVVVLGDHDEPGARHVAQVVASLRGKAASVRCPTLPGLGEGEDVADWLDRGGTGEQLRALAEGTEVVVGDLTQEEQDPQDPQEDQDPQLYVKRSEPCPAATKTRSALPLDLPLGDFLRHVQGAHQARQRDATAPWETQLFTAVRQLKAHPELAGMTAVGALRRVEDTLAGWDAPAGCDRWQEFFGLARADAEAAFVGAWERSRAVGQELRAALAEADANPIDLASGTPHPLPRYDRFLNLALRLQARYPGRSFPIATRAVGAALGVSYETISQYCQWAIADGFLTRTAESVWQRVGPRAAEYKFSRPATSRRSDFVVAEVEVPS